MATKAEAGKALGKVTNSIKENLEKTVEERQANRHELQKAIPCAAGGWVTAEHWLGTFTINGIDWHDTEEHIKYLLLLKDARETAEAYNTPNDYACPVGLHLTYLKMCFVHRTDVHDLLGDAISDKERKALANVEQGHNQQICWDLTQLAKALKKTGGTVTVPTLGSVTSKDCLELAHSKGHLSLKQLNGAETDLHPASLQAALGATKKNIAQVLEEQGSDNAKVAAFLASAKENYDRHGSVSDASYQEMGYRKQPAVGAPEGNASIARRCSTDPEPAERVGHLAANDSTTCIICMEAERTVVFMPCTHFACCQSCASVTSHCCICRAVIESASRVIVS